MRSGPFLFGKEAVENRAAQEDEGVCREGVGREAGSPKHPPSITGSSIACAKQELKPYNCGRRALRHEEPV